MKKIALVAVAAALLASAAHAEGKMGGLGFRSGASGVSASVPGFAAEATPTIGIRHWLSERAGFDVGFGFVSLNQETGPPTVDTFDGTGFSFDLGIPISAKRWEKVNVIVRPGFSYGTGTLKAKTIPTPPNELTATAMAFSGELEVEWMLAERLSISASHGIAYGSFKVEDNDSPANETKLTTFQNTGDNFTSLGFHVYLW